jgi:hypothetical protein
VLEYIEFVPEPEEATPTADRLDAIRRGEEEYKRGESLRWRDVKPSAFKMTVRPEVSKGDYTCSCFDTLARTGAHHLLLERNLVCET